MGKTQTFSIPQYCSTPTLISDMDRFVFFVIATLSILQGFSAAQVKDCVSSCKGVATGDYPSCEGCEYYVTCMYGNLIGPRHCPKGTVFDSRMKRCDHEWKVQDCKVEEQEQGNDAGSDGTVAPIKESRCIDSCKGLPLGDYQSCYTCSMYISCAPGHYPLLRPCPGGLVWNDLLKVCDWTSPTCSDKELRTTTTQAPSTTELRTTAPAPSTTEAEQPSGSGDGESSSGDGEIIAINW